MEAGLYENSFSLFEEALEIKPGNFEVLTNYGRSLMQAQKYCESISRFEEALQIKPGNSEVSSHYIKVLNIYANNLNLEKKLDRIPDILKKNIAT